MSPDGAKLVYAGYVGGEGLDAGFDVAVDAERAAYLVGVTGSSQNRNTSDPPFVNNQLGPLTLDTVAEAEICLPSLKSAPL